MKNVNEVETRTDLIQLCGKNKYVVVKWGAAWCQPCKQMEPVYHKLVDAFVASKQTKNAVVFASADIEVYKDSGVRSVPTVIVYDSAGNKVKSWVGFRDLTDLSAALKPYLYGK